MTRTGVDADACAHAHRALRERVTALARDAGPEALVAVAPATPEWRVRDVLAHLAGVNTDILTGTLDGVASDAWTATQVEARRDRPVGELLDEWATSAREVEANAALLGSAAGQWLTDACTHEHDVRQALGQPGARDADAVLLAFDWCGDRLGDLLDQRERPGITFDVPGGAKRVGSTSPHTGVHASEFELLRAMVGRRSRAQVEALAWDGPPRADHLVLGIFTLRPDDLVE